MGGIHGGEFNGVFNEFSCLMTMAVLCCSIRESPCGLELAETRV